MGWGGFYIGDKVFKNGPYVVKVYNNSDIKAIRNELIGRSFGAIKGKAKHLPTAPNLCNELQSLTLLFTTHTFYVVVV